MLGQQFAMINFLATFRYFLLLTCPRTDCSFLKSIHYFKLFARILLQITLGLGLVHKQFTGVYYLWKLNCRVGQVSHTASLVFQFGRQNILTCFHCQMSVGNTWNCPFSNSFHTSASKLLIPQNNPASKWIFIRITKRKDRKEGLNRNNLNLNSEWIYMAISFHYYSFYTN